MDHTQRRKLAQGIAHKLEQQYREQLVLVGLIGSVARNEDTPWSDLDLLVVMRDADLPPARALLFQGSVISFEVVEQSALERTLSTPKLGWPFYMGLLETVEVLTGSADLPKKWHNLGLTPSEQAFQITLERELPGLVFESYGRIRSCGMRGNEYDVLPAVIEMLDEMLVALCLLNRRWVTRGYYRGFEQSFRFERRPAGWEHLVPKLWMTHELSECITLAGQLMSAYWQMLTFYGLNVPNYQTVESLAL
jgi:kanamycin nucleotidyltransferase